MRYLTLAALNDQALTNAFNTVYEEYVVPLRFSVEQMRQHVIANAIQLDHSPLWLDDTGAVVALAALGVREHRGWVGGFGIAQPYRGRGLSHTLIAAVLAGAEALQLTQVQLEVLTGNAPAIAVYEQAGFVQRRDLCILSWEGAQPTTERGGAEVRPAEVATLVAYAARLHDTPPSWQREASSIAATPGLAGLMLGSSASPAAYVIYQASDAAVRVADLAADPAAAAAPLLGALAERFPDRRMSLSNEPAESRLIGVLAQHGWREILRQHEMVWSSVDRSA